MRGTRRWRWNRCDRLCWRRRAHVGSAFAGDERLKPKTERSTLLSYTVFHGGMEHLKIETRLIDERFESVVGECVIVTIKVCHLKYLMLFVMKR
jgi:hypothetical protein